MEQVRVDQILERHMPISSKGKEFCKQKTLQAHKQKSKILSHIYNPSFMEIYIDIISHLEQ